MTNPHTILSSLKVSGNLPSMPQVLVQLIDGCHDSEATLQDMAQIVDKDAAISAKLLQLVNSAFVGARKAITNVEQAVVYLGLDTVRNLAISVSVQQVFRRVETNGLLSIDRFWHHSFLNALLARNIAVAIDYPEPSEAYLAGLLHDVGKLLLWMAFPGKYAPLLLKGIRCHNARLTFLEEEKLFVNHCEAGAWLCEQWQLPALLADAIRYHHHDLEEVEQALPLTRITHLTDLLSHSDCAGQDCLEAAERLFNFTPTQVSAFFHGVDEQIADIAEQMGIHIPQAAKTSQDQEPESTESHKKTSLELINRIRDITQLDGVLENLLRAEDREQIIRTVEQGLTILFNEEACLMMLPDAKTGVFHCHVSPDNRLARETRGFIFSPERHGDSLPAQAIRQRQLLHSAEKVSATGKSSTNILDAQLLRLLGTEEMVAIPMVHRETVQGLLVIGLKEKSSRNQNGQWKPLRLLANHAAVSLYLEGMHAAQAERIAEARVEAASLVARKIAHEINNPLAILRNYIHILNSKSKKGEDIGEELAIIDGELERIGQITGGLEDLAHDQPAIHLQEIDLHRQLDESLRLFRASLPADDRVRLTYIPPEKPVLVRTDIKFLRQIMQNLLGNALDAVAGQGQITVRLTTASKTVVISVEDDGTGIDPSLQNQLFNAGTSTKTGRHSGLGLHIVKKLAERLGGSIQFRSGQGATVFSLTLPA